MSLSLAQRSAWSLAKTLMVCVTLFKAGNGYSVVPSAEFDGELVCGRRRYRQIRSKAWVADPVSRTCCGPTSKPSLAAPRAIVRRSASAAGVAV